MLAPNLHHGKTVSHAPIKQLVNFAFARGVCAETAEQVVINAN